MSSYNISNRNDMDNKQLVSLAAPVVHVATDERSRNWDLEKNSSLINKRVQIISEDDLPTIINSNKYSLPKSIYAGDILIKDPFEQNSYMKLDDNIAQRIRYKKYCKIREIAQKLGASGCDIKEASCIEEERIWDVNVGVNFNTISAHTNINNNESLSQKIGILVHNEFGGKCKISEKSFSEAKMLSQIYNLDDDDSIKSLINMRDPDQENPLFIDSFHFDMSSECNSLLDITFSLNAINFNLDANVKRTIRKRESIIIDVKFIFPTE